MAILIIPEEASKLLTQFKGVQRNAEEKAWNNASQFKPNSDGYEFWKNVAICIWDGQEEPKVERSHYIPTPAFKSLATNG